MPAGPATLLVLALFLSSMCATIAGVYLLAGAGWAFVTGGAMLMVAAALVRSGLKADG
ncbi:hypothetical protein ACFQ1E_17370 [Sphingomonas canadensis]|uniref:Uncharacterized protein n=1 Tax=Sphingomonas canadensis TaxID=1219257 RepID=A0ABW3HAC8_9SPHN|nr:hypothetical protein [Sphingomonas canadensis]MCW3837818.1 hypothetical protein [Sphingomonas canadensis]